MKPQPRYKAGDKIGGRYRIHQALMGGMGEVYLCLDLEDNIPLALKTLRKGFWTSRNSAKRLSVRWRPGWH
ncbi:MAG: hypothetical protein RBT80_09235 [Candidatus Vecturithrix sp.]|jgi:serine/threonine protein kinase|nr:hypothetical protein [Candidatus Vecturithrix sp.]